MSSKAMTPTNASGITQSNSPAPTKSSQRIVDIDVLRGFALFGILFVNIFYFNAPDPFFDQYYAQFTGPINQIIYRAVLHLFTGKFYPIFSFLFGFGFFLQYTKLKQRGETYRFFVRRLVVLLLFGIAHVLFIWEEDILIFYALFGFVLLPLAERPPRLILTIGILAYFVPIIFVVIASTTGHTAAMEPKFNSLLAYEEFYRNASYLQIMQLRLSLYAAKLFGFAGLISHFDRLAFFLFGLYAGKMDFFNNLTENKGRWARSWAVAFVIMTAGFILKYTWFRDFSHSNRLLLSGATETLSDLIRFAQVYVYIVGFLLLLNQKLLRRWMMVFAGPGRTSLTIYLMHTTVYALLFYSFGLKLYGVWSPIQLLSGVIILFGIQIILSNLWLRYFTYGPLEWIWRILTYKKILALRKAVAMQSSKP